MSVNKVFLMGRLTKTPELKTTTSGISCCRFSIAVDRYNKNSEEKKADFFNVTAWRGTADFVAKYFTKGRMIFVEGDLMNNDYTDNNGVKHYSMTVNAQNVSFCGDKQASSDSPQYRPSQDAVPQQSNSPAPAPAQSVVSDLGDFEEILSVGDVPF